MAFIVQTDDGLTANANSYVSVAEWTTYFTDRNNTVALAYTDAEIQAALIYATTWLDDTFKWYSMLVNTSQTTGWPRVDYWDSEGRVISGIPQKIKDAACEMGLEHLSSPINTATDDSIVSESYGDASVTYNRGTGGSKSFSKIKVSLKDYGTNGSSRSNTLYRA